MKRLIQSANSSRLASQSCLSPSSDAGSRFTGSKGGAGVWQRIISEMPPHRLYVEPFMGKAVVGLRKRPAERNWFVDADVLAPGFHACRDLPGGRAEIGDGVQYLRKWRGELADGGLVYCDPPYLFEVRQNRRYYREEFGHPEQHRELIDVLRSLPCPVLLSGYWSELYESLLADWRTILIPTVNRQGREVLERVWCNFPTPTEFHDPRWVGRDFRERERSKRKVSSLAHKWQALSHGERAMFAAAIAGTGEPRGG